MVLRTKPNFDTDRRTVSVMPDEPAPKPDPAVEGDEVDDVALQPDTPPPAAVPVEPADTGYTPSGVPTFDSVREKIETRYGTAIGASELAAETPEGRTVEEQYDARQRAAAERLAQIRESMRKPDDEDQ
jgi:phage shock protein A